MAIRVAVGILVVVTLVSGVVGCGEQRGDGVRAEGSSAEVESVEVPRRVEAFAYDCGGDMYVVASYTVGTDELWLFLPGRTVQLAHEQSGSGAKYSNGEITFWSKGHEALLDVGDGQMINCTENRRASILETVKLNGGDFWATGNEPGWILEIYPGRFVLVASYGQDRYEGALSDPEEDAETRQAVFRAVGGEVDVEITLIGKPCADTMSDHRYETTVVVRVGERVYRGCGQALH